MENPIVNGTAMKFLSDKLLGQKVFLRHDDRKYDEENNLLCYLYLKNKTFINAHLIKTGLANVDCLSDYRYKNKFIELERNYV
jgi:site-specific DNA-methyltransferase (adenine-specific)